MSWSTTGGFRLWSSSVSGFSLLPARSSRFVALRATCSQLVGQLELYLHGFSVPTARGHAASHLQLRSL